MESDKYLDKLACRRVIEKECEKRRELEAEIQKCNKLINGALDKLKQYEKEG